jgi:hypothetical protein
MLILLVHPQNYEMLKERLVGITGEDLGGSFRSLLEIHQDPYVPLTTIKRVKKRRVGLKRRKWHRQRYKTVEVPVLGWMVDQSLWSLGAYIANWKSCDEARQGAGIMRAITWEGLDVASKR